ncbi:hypothetical protein FA15DRAFT_728077 [Coprinopsis marcescibilis]|uniref:Mid2 domain-containing protein n=1 Tax=Coprinopsis marcescibilis TaxID=230819 RepID=A0A5C3KFQ4_COPMA|nr:hypothetical protein FA15DRAFT_728077 [Coprinopsis marcescibilis]
MSNTVTIDDSDPAITWLTHHWVVHEFPGRSYGGTVHVSPLLGATMTYVFTGTQISVYGLVNPGDSTPAVASFSVNGIHHREFRAVYGNRTAFDVPLYQSPDLGGPGPHTLQATNLRENDRMYVDYMVTALPTTSAPPPPSSPPPPPPPPPSSSIPDPEPTTQSLPPSTSDIIPTESEASDTSALPSSSVVPGINETNTFSRPTMFLDSPNPSPSAGGSVAVDSSSGNATTSHSQAGVIAGAVVGGVGLLAVLVLVVVFILRRRRARSARLVEPDEGSPKANALSRPYRTGAYNDASYTFDSLDEKYNINKSPVAFTRDDDGRDNHWPPNHPPPYSS